MDFELLLAHADDQRPVLEEALPLHSASTQPRPAEVPSGKVLIDAGVDPNSLPDQRWGLVVPEGPLGDRLLALIEPLRRLREAEQGAPARVYRVRPDMDALQSVRWKDTVLRDESEFETEQPGYLLLLGDFDQVSLELQQVLGSDGFAGRLAFSSDAGYESYVDKVLRWSREPSQAKAGRALLFTAHDGTAATTVGYRALMEPSLETLRKLREMGSLSAESLAELGAPQSWSAQQLLTQVSSPQPSVLFTMSHGVGLPRGGWRSVDEQRARQGAMSLGVHGTLDASALASTPFLPGGIWFFLACFGAGTPARSAYYPWLSRLREAGEYSGQLERLLAALPREGERPFVAALPQAVLANAQGPLAVVGHVDLAWTYSFQDLGTVARNRPSRFLGLLRNLLEGRRAGAGLSALLRFFNEANTELTTLYDQDESARLAGRDSSVNSAERAHLWMLRQDLSGYILLGDPAVRLPLTGAAAVPREVLPERRNPFVAPALPVAQSQVFAMGALPSAEDMAEAVLVMLSGEESERALATRVGVPLAELRRWKKVFTEAGLKALAGLRAPG
ncbi:hypothetical protein [Hyalangium versicolor]|uniref:hypothetical protein n=1 Tax=Hyalangium versicolor TaxID=2861190 RepID=UPI001CCAAC99|nr:hypothetical protein [Hyalangium versicolor]